MKLKKWLCICIALVLSVFGFVGCNCSCEEEETADAKYLRLYDINQNKVIDDWELPFNYGTYNGVTYASRGLKDNNGKDIESNVIKHIYNEVDLNNITSLSQSSNYSSMVIEFHNSTYFNRSTAVELACYNARAYIVHIKSANELKSFAQSNLAQTDSHKYILVLDNDISFRTGESTGNPKAMFGKVDLINLNGASLYGNGKTIDGFILTPNSPSGAYDKNGSISSDADKGIYDDYYLDANNNSNNGTLNLKYSLFSNASAVYDLNIHMGHCDIVIEPRIGQETGNYSLIIDVAPLRNVGVIDNIKTRGKIDLATSVETSSATGNQANIEIDKVNISMLAIGEDGDAEAKVLSGDKFLTLEDYTTQKQDDPSLNIIYDYDRIIKTSRIDTPIYEENTPEGEEPKIVGYDRTYLSTYDNKITNQSIDNINVEGYIDYKENVKSSTSESIMYYRPAKSVNVGGIYANAQNDYTTTTHTNSNISVNLTTGASITMGGIMSNMSQNAFAEDNVATLKSNITYINDTGANNVENVSVIGGISGLVADLAELKNSIATSDITIVGEENVNGNTSTHISVGGATGLNLGMLVYCDTDSTINIDNCDVVSTGAVAGSSYNGVFVKNLATANVVVDDSVNAYNGTVVGSAVGGMIYKCIAESVASIKAYSERTDNISVDLSNNTLGIAGRINAGLLYFQSQNFYWNYLKVKELIEVTDEIEFIVDSLLADSIFYNGAILLGAQYAPKQLDNVVIDNTDIQMDLLKLEDETTDGGDVIERIDTYLGQYVNIGGFHIYLFDNTNYVFEEINNLRYYNSSLRVNGSKDIYYTVDKPEQEPEPTPLAEGDEVDLLVIKDAYNQEDTNKVNRRLSNIGTFTLEYLRNFVEFNGIKGLINELENTLAEGVNVAGMKFNNIYPGKYLAPDNFKDLQLDTDLFADLEIDSYDEFEYVLDVFMNKNTSSNTIYNTKLLRKDLLKVMMFKTNMFNYNAVTDELEYKKLVLSNSNDYRYERDKEGNLIYEYSNVYGENTPIRSNTDSATDALFFGKSTGFNAGKLFAFKKSSLKNSQNVDTGEVVYYLPDGYEEILDTDNYKEVIDSLNPVEIMMLYRITQVIGVESIEIEYNPNRVEGRNLDGFSRLMFTIHYRGNETRSATYALDTMTPYVSPDNIADNYNTTCVLYLIKSTNQGE